MVLWHRFDQHFPSFVLQILHSSRIGSFRVKNRLSLSSFFSFLTFNFWAKAYLIIVIVTSGLTLLYGKLRFLKYGLRLLQKVNPWYFFRKTSFDTLLSRYLQPPFHDSTEAICHGNGSVHRQQNYKEWRLIHEEYWFGRKWKWALDVV